MNLSLYQVKQAYLSLKQKPGFVVSIVASMGITLGALLSVMTLAYVLLISPLPYPEQERLFKLDHTFLDGDNDVFDPRICHTVRKLAAFLFPEKNIKNVQFATNSE